MIATVVCQERIRTLCFASERSYEIKIFPGTWVYVDLPSFNSPLISMLPSLPQGGKESPQKVFRDKVAYAVWWITYLGVEVRERERDKKKRVR